MLLLNNRPIDYFLFSGGELQIKLPQDLTTERVILTWKPTDASELVFLALAVNALKHMGITDIDLDVLYLPYARQDRVCSTGEAHSLEVVCKFLNDLDVSAIRLWDVHNDEETTRLLPNNYIWHWEVQDIFARHKILDNFDLYNLILCAPDGGGVLRVNQIVDRFNLSHPVFLEKNRNSETGQIDSLEYGEYNRSVDTADVMIVDDICDGGATFIEAAELLKHKGADKLYLYITHGIFSKGLDELLEHFEHIYCHHVLHDDQYQSTDRLTILQEIHHAPEPLICN